MKNLNPAVETATIELNDGAMCGLSDGAKMDVISSIVEYVDNAEDANASKVSIIVDNENNTLTVLSVEETTLEKTHYKKLFNLGVGGKLHTKKNGVGKYSQGFKYAGPHLIGEGNKGEIRVAVRPVSGNNWGATQFIDYTNDNNYTDKNLVFTDDAEMPEGYNFMVKVVGCKKISRNDLVKLSVELGIRYREKIENNNTTININNADVLPQDRLYSKFGNEVDYHAPIYLEWNGDKKAATWEWSDLRKKEFQDTELIDYDTTLGISGRVKGTTISSRSCAEVAINGVTIINEHEWKNLTSLDAQPSSCGFRGRLNILNRDLADAYIKGGNKSCSSVNKSFGENDDTQIIRMQLKDDYNTIIRRYHSEDAKNKKYYTISSIDQYCIDSNINCSFKFVDDDKSVETFTFDGPDNRIFVNTNSELFSGFSTEKAKDAFMCALLSSCKGKSGEYVWKRLKMFKNEWEIHIMD